jgi:hypothetical protein
VAVVGWLRCSRSWRPRPVCPPPTAPCRNFGQPPIPTHKGGEFYGPRWGNNGAPVRKPIVRPGIDDGIEKPWLVSGRETGVALEFGVAATTS